MSVFVCLGSRFLSCTASGPNSLFPLLFKTPLISPRKPNNVHGSYSTTFQTKFARHWNLLALLEQICAKSKWPFNCKMQVHAKVENYPDWIFIKIVGLLCCFRFWPVRLQTHVSHFAPIFMFNYKVCQQKFHDNSPYESINFKSWMCYFRRDLLGLFSQPLVNPVFLFLNFANFSSMEFNILVYKGLRDVGWSLLPHRLEITIALNVVPI